MSIDATGRFSCQMEWGTEIRGRYEIVVRPSLIAMRWDFADSSAPVPIGELIGYLRLAPTPPGTRVTVHQMTSTPDQAEFMSVAWATVLGRLTEGLATTRRRPARRTPRAKTPRI